MALLRKVRGRTARAAEAEGAQVGSGTAAVPGHARLAKAAVAQWAAVDRELGDPPPATGDFTLPWWRIQGLRSLAAVLVPPIFLITVGAADAANGFALHGSGHKLVFAGFLILFCALAVKRAVEQIRTARALARAAASPFTRTRRYVVANWPWSKGDWLLLFPADGDSQATPEATLLLPYGRVGRRRLGFPPRPVGEVELRSLPARPQDVVPFFDGRPVWARSQMLDIPTGDPDAIAPLIHFANWAADDDSDTDGAEPDGRGR
ncbi:hypothetical protein AB0M29_05450 [Streptomyces sp. NPDC051976]|uniref:hypothetical protein n=1 Tax=Streptomyces sp. NPDC051976 TaxID=3154947 RepID=UPI003441586C